MLSPAPPHWDSPQAIAHQAHLWLQELHLTDWSFGWDRALRRLGCCNMSKKRVTLSHHFVAHYLSLSSDKQQIITQTLLHELAHCLAWVHHQSRGHGPIWRQYCTQLGIPHARACTKCEDFDKPLARYAIIIADSGEVVRYYSRKPRLSPARLKRSFIPGRQSETMGRLRLVELP